MSILSFISSIFEPAVKLVDELHTSDEEKLALRKQIRQAENEFLSKVLDYETQLLNNQADIVKAEATGQSWLQRNWRPITMLTFLVLVVLDSFDLLAFRLSEEAWVLLQIGLGGYVAGRSAEKITQQVVANRNRKDSEAKG
ncbi:3TM-type holin [Corallincola platygyrae]|uniref:3TM-type holin n=1 Tax=Corallincola platygyrae TaxID=1193278 RepID=A0ABW4XJF1_9GAMM